MCRVGCTLCSVTLLHRGPKPSPAFPLHLEVFLCSLLPKCSRRGCEYQHAVAPTSKLGTSIVPQVAMPLCSRGLCPTFVNAVVQNFETCLGSNTHQVGLSAVQDIASGKVRLFSVIIVSAVLDLTKPRV